MLDIVIQHDAIRVHSSSCNHDCGRAVELLEHDNFQLAIVDLIPLKGGAPLELSARAILREVRALVNTKPEYHAHVDSNPLFSRITRPMPSGREVYYNPFQSRVDRLRSGLEFFVPD